MIPDIKIQDYDYPLPPERIAALAAEAPWKGAGGATSYAAAKGTPVLVLDGDASTLTLFALP